MSPGAARGRRSAARSPRPAPCRLPGGRAARTRCSRAWFLARRARGDMRTHSSSRASVLAARALLLLLQGQPVAASARARTSSCPPRGCPGPGRARGSTRDVVEEVAVVGDGHHRAGILLEMPLEPGHALGVEVVGGLVEQEDVGLLKQDPAQRHAPALAAGEGARRRHRRGAAAWRPWRSRSVRSRSQPFGGLDGVLHAGLLSSSLSISSASGPSPSLVLISSKRFKSPRTAATASRRCRARPGWVEMSAPGARSRSRTPSAGCASPMKSGPRPAMMRSSVLLPEPLPPMTPILAPG